MRTPVDLSSLSALSALSALLQADWRTTFESNKIIVGVCNQVNTDFVVQIQVKMEVDAPQSNCVVYRFYDYAGVLTDWRHLPPDLVPLRFSVRRFVPVLFFNSRNVIMESSDYIYLGDHNADVVCDIIKSYDSVFSEFSRFRNPNQSN